MHLISVCMRIAYTEDCKQNRGILDENERDRHTEHSPTKQQVNATHRENTACHLQKFIKPRTNKRKGK